MRGGSDPIRRVRRPDKWAGNPGVETEKLYESVFEREKEKKKRLDYLKNSSTTVYSNLNMSTKRAQETLQLILNSSTQHRKEDEERKEKEREQQMLSIVKLNRKPRVKPQLPVLDDESKDKQNSSSKHEDIKDETIKQDEDKKIENNFTNMYNNMLQNTQPDDTHPKKDALKRLVASHGIANLKRSSSPSSDRKSPSPAREPSDHIHSVLANPITPSQSINFGPSKGSELQGGNSSKAGAAKSPTGMGQIEDFNDLDRLYKKYLQDNMKAAGLNTLSAVLSPRKEAQYLKDFLTISSERLKRERKNDPAKLLQLTEELVLFASNVFSKLLKTEMKDYYEVFNIFNQLREYTKISRLKNNSSKLEAYKKQIADLKAEMGKKVTVSSSKIAEIASSPKSEEGFINKISEVVAIEENLNSQLTALNKQLEAARQEKDLVAKSFNSKEKKYIAMMNKLQERMTFLKKMNLSLIQKYNLQSEKINKIKQRLLFYVKKVDQNSDLREEEEMLDAELMKAGEENEGSIENQASFISGGENEEEEEGDENHKAKAQKQGGMEAVEQQDKFDYSIIYKRRHINHKSHSQRKNPRTYYPESQHVKYYKEILQKRNYATETKGLILYREIGTQSLISFAERKYDRILQNQYDLEIFRRRNEFETGIVNHINDHKHMCFMTDGFMRKMTLLIPPPTPVPTNLDDLKVDATVQETELMQLIEEHASEFHQDEDSYNNSLKQAVKENYFHPELIEEYLNHRVSISLPVTEALVKYLFLSYVFGVHSQNKQVSVIQRKEDQVAVLFKLCQQYKSKLKDYDKTLKKLQDDFQSFLFIHKGCSMSHLMTDFKLDKIKNSETENEKEGKQAMAITTLINKIKKMKMIMKMTAKKYFSSKIVYQKLYHFFQMRAGEVEYLENLQVKHVYSLEEHFFRYFTEKENGLKKVEEKIKNFIITIFNLESCPKIETFKKFTNLSSAFPYTKVEEYYYLKAIEFIKTECRGLDIPPDLHKGTNYVPYEKFEMYLYKFVLPKLNSKVTNNLWKELKGQVITNLDSVAKKGVIDIDIGMEIVFRWINTKSIMRFGRDYAFFLFSLVDYEKQDAIYYDHFVKLYKIFNLDYYGESTRLLAKVNSGTIKKEVTLEEMIEQIGTVEQNQATEKPWMAANYIYSMNQLKEVFCKYSEQEYKEDVEPTSKLDWNQFHSLINEFDNLLDFDKLYRFIGIQESFIENEFYSAMNTFNNNYKSYLKFIEDCKIKDNAWKDSFRERLKELRFTFGVSKQFDEEIKMFKETLIENNIECNDDQKITNNVMLKFLLLNKQFVLDLIRTDFEQRFDYIHLQELPFE